MPVMPICVDPWSIVVNRQRGVTVTINRRYGRAGPVGYTLTIRDGHSTGHEFVSGTVSEAVERAHAIANVGR